MKLKNFLLCSISILLMQFVYGADELKPQNQLFKKTSVALTNSNNFATIISTKSDAIILDMNKEFSSKLDAKEDVAETIICVDIYVSCLYSHRTMCGTAWGLIAAKLYFEDAFCGEMQQF